MRRHAGVWVLGAVASCGQSSHAAGGSESNAVVVGIETPLRVDLSTTDAEAPLADASPAHGDAPEPTVTAPLEDSSDGARDLDVPDSGASLRGEFERGESGRGDSVDLDPERVLVATSRQTFIYERPDFASPKLGYLASGTVVARSAEPIGFSKCDAGFYSIEPEGFVCVGKAASLDADHPIIRVEHRRPNRKQALPYVYAKPTALTPHLYTRVPTRAERAALEPRASARSWRGWGRSTQSAAENQAVSPVPAPRAESPEFLSGNAPSLRSNGEPMNPLELSLGRAVSNSSFGLVDLFEAEGEAWGLTTELLLLPLSQLERIEPSAFAGVELGEAVTLPLAFVRERHAALYVADSGSGLRFQRKVAYREAFSLTGQTRRSGGFTYLETRDGYWLRDTEGITRISPVEGVPHWARPGRTWIDVSLSQQTLVAYLGLEPVFATLVSTGRDRLGDPETSHATVQGEFLIHTKHVTHTMSNDEEGDVYDHRAVPYVQFFKDGYALHAAYWHDAFGTPKSHGCINLSPHDARWLFEWTDPHVYDHWYGAMSLLGGTLVSIHP